MLPTPPHDDAVTFRYRPESVYLKRTYTSLIKHTHKRTFLSLRNPAKSGRATLRLFQKARGPKRFVRIPSGGHNDPQPEEYRQAFDQFLMDLPPMSRP